MIVCLNYIQNLYDILMFYHLQNSNLSSDRFFSLRFTKFTLLINFDSNFSIRWFVSGHSYRSICTLSNNFSNCIILPEFWSKIRFYLRLKEFINSILIHFFTARQTIKKPIRRIINFKKLNWISKIFNGFIMEPILRWIILCFCFGFTFLK